MVEFVRKTLCIFTLLMGTQIASATVVIDLSPDTTGVIPGNLNYTNEYGGQIIGDRFTLLTDTILTGGAIFSKANKGTVGDGARFLVFEDMSGTPSATPLIDIVTMIDVIDTAFTTIQTELTRKHATITPTALAAGTYWFSLPGISVNLAAASGNYDNNTFGFGPSSLTSYCCGDMYLMLETSVPAPSALLLLVPGVLLMRFRRIQAPKGRRGKP
jgi:hypothetical protein